MNSTFEVRGTALQGDNAPAGEKRSAQQLIPTGAKSGVVPIVSGWRLPVNGTSGMTGLFGICICRQGGLAYGQILSIGTLAAHQRP